MTADEVRTQFPLTDEQGDRYYDDSSHLWRTKGMGPRPNLCYEWRGFKNPDPSGWRLSRERLEEEHAKGNIVILPSGRLQRRKYERDYRGKQPGSCWTDIPPATGSERTGWSTQKPVALYERIIRASSNEGDLVLDPFAGCSTTLVAAERLRRQWIGCDIDPKAEPVVMEQMTKLLDPAQGRLFENRGTMAVRKSAPCRTDVDTPSDAKLRTLLHKNQAGRCANPYCTSTGLRVEDVELDHRIPKSRGGPDTIDNRIGLCGSCNRRKGRKAVGVFLDEERAREAHPALRG